VIPVSSDIIFTTEATDNPKLITQKPDAEKDGVQWQEARVKAAAINMGLGRNVQRSAVAECRTSRHITTRLMKLRLNSSLRQTIHFPHERSESVTVSYLQLPEFEARIFHHRRV
jgi:hypothetical protein